MESAAQGQGGYALHSLIVVRLQRRGSTTGGPKENREERKGAFTKTKKIIQRDEKESREREFFTPNNCRQGIKRNADNRATPSYCSLVMDHEPHTDEEDGCYLSKVLCLDKKQKGVTWPRQSELHSITCYFGRQSRDRDNTTNIHSTTSKYGYAFDAGA